MSNLSTTQGGQAIFVQFAQRFGLDSNKVSNILKNTAFNASGREATEEQMAALLVVANQFNLNPFVKEIYAFPDSTGRGIVPIVSVDGWARIANEHPQYDGVEFRYAEQTVSRGNKKIPAWIEAVIYRKDRSHPTVVREYLEECERKTGPWDTHPQRMLRHKAFMQCCRVALSFGGIYDEDEGERIATARIMDMQQAMPASIDIPSVPALSPSPADQFDAVIQNAGFADQQEKVAAYLNVCAKHFSKSVEEVKAEICSRPEDFTKTFPAWVKSVEQQKQQQGKKARTTGKEDKKPETATAQAPSAEASPTHNPQTGEVFGPDADSGYRMTCPATEKQVDELDCVSCKMRKDCPAWEYKEGMQ